MKIIITPLFIVLSIGVAMGQPENRKLLPDYPLMGNVADRTGNNADLELINVEILDSALYSNGANSFSDTANRVFGYINALDLDDIYISLEFRLDSVNDDDRPRSVIVGGSGWRWLAATYTQASKQIKFNYNNFNSSGPAFNYEYNRWYTLILTYQRATRLGSMYIDGELIASAVFDLDANSDRSIVLDCYCGIHSMGGYWRSLQIWGPDTSFIQDPLRVTCELSKLISDAGAEDGEIHLQLAGGLPPYKVFVDDQIDTIQVDTTDIQLSGFAHGLHQIKVLDQHGNFNSCEIEFLAPPTDLTLISDFPMTVDGSDQLGVHQDLEITNAPLIPGTGLYSQGHEDRDTFNQILGRFFKLDPDNFYLSIDVRLDSIEDDPYQNFRDLFVLGLGWRWLAPAYSPSSKTFILYHNNWKLVPDFTQSFVYGQWYEIGLSHNKASGLVQMFVDRKLIGEAVLDLDTGGDLSFGLWCNCGPDPMRGYWRNLRIYGEQEGATASRNEKNSLGINMYPNPVQDQLYIELDDWSRKKQSFIRIYRSDGLLIYRENITDQTGLIKINTQNWLPGVYHIDAGINSRSFLKL
ncbi:MAG: T9SS type A sorting domain-containing protein [Saprospiraceae bacterium]|nr:T9SS type A sorting domain-containing protein [Saprospiraceae bacterium]